MISRLETRDDPRADPQPITVHVPTDAGFVAMATTQTPDGGFTVAGVPPGEVYVQVGSFYVVTTDRTVNLDSYMLGRPTTQAPSSTVVSTTMSGLTASDFPSVWISTPNNGFVSDFFFLNAPFSSQVTSVTNEPASFDRPSGGLPDGVSTDSTWVYETVDRNPGFRLDAGFELYSSIERSSSQMGVNIAPDGGSFATALALTGTRVTQSTTIRAGEFASWRTAVHPLATASVLSLEIVPTPHPAGTPEVWAGYSGSLLTYYGSWFPSVDIPFALEFVDPFPGWTRVYTYAVGFSAPTLLAGTTSGRISGYLLDNTPQVQAVSVPRLSPPTSLMVEGRSATNGALTLTSRQPRITWSAPALGTASGYLVMIYRLSRSGTSTTRALEQTIFTQGLAVRPPQALQPGTSYALRVRALYTPGLDLRATPFAHEYAVDFASADTVSNVLTTP